MTKALTEPKVIESIFDFKHLSVRMMIDHLLEQPNITEEQKERLLFNRKELDDMWKLFYEMVEHTNE